MGQIEQLIAPLLEQESVELVDLKFAKEGSGWVLRFFLDKEGGITMDDCAYLSERIGSLLDTSDIISHSYTLEVSSPGLDRVLKKERDFERFLGKTIRLRLKAPLKGQRNFKGRLLGFKEGKVLMEEGGQAREFELSQIEETRLDYAADISW
ncbi:MAG: ribosome maturation factor RimP [Elusimicrobia bacterium]|nr:ribosome maturation factor RimP [Elusimicrobiota bacterium]